MIFIEIKKRAEVYDPIREEYRPTWVPGMLRVEDIVRFEKAPGSYGTSDGTVVTISTPSENIEVYVSEDYDSFCRRLAAIAGDQFTGDLLKMNKVSETIGYEEEKTEIFYDTIQAEDFLSRMFDEAGLSWEDAEDREELDALEEEYYPEEQYPKPNCAEGRELDHFKEFAAKAKAWFDKYLETRQPVAKAMEETQYKDQEKNND